jgi:uncharacterized protein (TIGR02172 family)
MEIGALIGVGRTAEVFVWGEDRVLKLYQDWMPAGAIEREFALTRLAYATGLPVPAAEEMVEVEGRLGIVFERIRGTSMLKAFEDQPWKLISISRLLAELHARMHACVLPLDTTSQRQQIEQGLTWANTLSDSEKETNLGILTRLPEGNVLCHGDYHPDNIILSDHGPVIIDWMTGRRGHPLGDVARTALLLQTGGLPPKLSPAMRLLINISRRWIHSVYLNRYLQLHPASRNEIDAWQLPLLAARLFEVEAYPQEKELILRRIRGLLANREK